MPLKLWWALASVAAIAAVYALIGLRKKDRVGAASALFVAAGCAIAGYVFRDAKYEAQNLPIYSYGVMLGLSLVVGWYLTLTLAERDGLPKETMANCYVVTAIAALLGARLLYVVTNPDEFKTWTDFFALRRGGLVAYGGFLGGYVGSWLFLQRNRIRLMPWADVAVPSLASGLLVTRVGCYLFGCDFGKRLPETAPAFLKKLGTFPHWAQGTLDGGDGSPAYVKHLEALRGTPLGAELLKRNASLPVHPTQLYESLVGLALLALLLWQRKHQKFRGQIFFLFAFAYGYLRFLLEILRDDAERGELGPLMSEHWLVSGSLLVMSVAFVFGVSLGITSPTRRAIARVLSFVPPVVAFVILRPLSFGRQVSVQLSTSQWIGLLSAVVCAYFYAQFWERARKTPKLAMSLESLGDIKPTDDDLRRSNRGDDDDDDDADADAQREERPRAKRRKKGPGVSEERTPLPVEAEESEGSEDEDEDASKGAAAAPDEQAEGASDEENPDVKKPGVKKPDVKKAETEGA